MKVTWFGHSCCRIEGGGARILIDPFFTGNPLATTSADQIDADFITVTHGHADHYGDTTQIAKRTKATVIANFEISNWAEKQGVPNTHSMHIGGSHHFSFGRLKLTIAHHGSSMPDGSYGGNPAGLLFTIENKKIYHSGDTGLFYDMKLIGDVGIDLAILPVGDNYTMGPEDALKAIELLRPKRILPIHYNTWPIIAQDIQTWAKKVTQTEVILLQPGQSLSL